MASPRLDVTLSGRETHSPCPVWSPGPAGAGESESPEGLESVCMTGYVVPSESQLGRNRNRSSANSAWSDLTWVWLLCDDGDAGFPA